jgi:formate-dependent phosphoribosylglycinamide formyltransferase (GAR transformylase)
MPRLLLLIPSTSYRVSDFVTAAHRLGVDVTIGSNERQVLETLSAGGTVTIDFANPKSAVNEIEKFHKIYPLTAVVAVDDVTGIIAAKASKKLGFRHNDPEAVKATGNKLLLRQKLNQSGLPSPKHHRVALNSNPNLVADKVDYPCVLKPLNLSASQGVIRTNNSEEFIIAFKRIKSLLMEMAERTQKEILPEILIEDYIEGEEVALEGLMVDGKLTLLALFDKPDPLEGPYFEETIYVTPSRKSKEVQASIKHMAEQAANSIGLREGPLHVELRIRPSNRNTNDGGPCIIEIAARSIGGLCSRSLQFGDSLTLEDIILRHALGDPILPVRETQASGVMMIPIPKAGILKSVDGTLEAQGIAGITNLTISIATGSKIMPLPEGNKYLGFIFAKEETPEKVEAALRVAHAKLIFEIT